MKVTMIAAMSENRVIGKNNDLPWHLPDDFQFFKDQTKGHHVIMGRKNYESLPHRFRPLPDRTNILLTRSTQFKAADSVIITHSMEQALEIALSNNEQQVFIIGGSEIYKMGLEVASELLLTEIHAKIEGDVYFPEFDRSEWKEISRQAHPADERHLYPFDFVTYVNKKHLDLY